MNEILKDTVAGFDSWHKSEHAALAEFIKQRGECDVFSYYSRLAAYLAARFMGDRLRVFIDREVFETALAECNEMGFETEQLTRLKALYEQVSLDDDD